MSFNEHEAVNLVDLHAQTKQPITESPLLMSAYTAHMVQVAGKRWKSSLPTHLGNSDEVFLISSIQEGHLPPRSQYFPEFIPMSAGFTALRMIPLHSARFMANVTAASDKQSFDFPSSQVSDDDSSSGSATPTHLRGGLNDIDSSDWDTDFFAWRRAAPRKPDESGSDDGECDSDSPPKRQTEDEGVRFADAAAAESNAVFEATVKERTTLVVKVKSAVDIYFSPLAIESLHRFVDSLTGTLRDAHPMVIVDFMETWCSNEVKARHVLLQEEKVNLWTESHSASAYADAKHVAEVSKQTSKFRTNSAVSAVLAAGGGVTSVVMVPGINGRPALADVTDGRGVVSVMEEKRCREFQALVCVPRINVAVLQTSLVEFMTTFSSLDQFQDLMCVSVLALSIDDARLEFYERREDHLSLQAIPGRQGQTDAGLMSGDKFSNFAWFRPKPKVGSLDKRSHFEPLMVETITNSKVCHLTHFCDCFLSHCTEF
jgi:hypothetical protein